MTSIQGMFDQIQESVSKTLANVFLYYDGENQKKAVEELKDVVENIFLSHVKLNKANDTIENIINEYSSREGDIKIEEILKKYESEVAKINPNISKDRNLEEFNRQVKDFMKVNSCNVEVNNDKNDDDDVQFTRDTVNVIDPFTKKRMTDPLKNKNCGHIYDRESIIAMLKVNPKVRCPVIGCGNKRFITMNNLESDVVLRTHLLKNNV